MFRLISSAGPVPLPIFSIKQVVGRWLTTSDDHDRVGRKVRVGRDFVLVVSDHFLVGFGGQNQNSLSVSVEEKLRPNVTFF